MEKRGEAQLGTSVCVGCNQPATTTVNGQLACKDCEADMHKVAHHEKKAADLPKEVQFPETSA